MDPFRTVNKYITILYRHNLTALAKLLEPAGLGIGQHSYILAVCEQPGITQDKLTGRMALNKSSVARAITQLEHGGFLTRRTDPADKRSYRLYPTDKGWQAYEEIHRRLDEVSRGLAEGLEAHEQAEAVRLLRKMAENAVLHKGESGGRAAADHAQSPKSRIPVKDVENEP